VKAGRGRRRQWREDRRLSQCRRKARASPRGSMPRTSTTSSTSWSTRRPSARVNWDDDIVKATVLTRDGAVVHPSFQPKTKRGLIAAQGRRTPTWPQIMPRSREPGADRRRNCASGSENAQQYADQAAAFAPRAFTPRPRHDRSVRVSVSRSFRARRCSFGYLRRLAGDAGAAYAAGCSVTNAISSVIVVGACSRSASNSANSTAARSGRACSASSRSTSRR